jgi:hypothetical protein
VDRRSFLKLGAASSAALTGISLTATLTGCTESLPENSDWKILREGDRTFLKAIFPLLMKGSLPTGTAAKEDALNKMLRCADGVVFKLDHHNQKQMIELFDLVNFSASRGLTTGVWSKWDEASDEEIEHFLNKWRESSIGLFNLAYNGLNRLACAGWFGLPESWQSVGYPGPRYANIFL